MSASARLAGSTALSVGLLFMPMSTPNAQPMFKCLKGNSVTYSNTSCEQLGLKPAGKVAQNRVTTVPGAGGGSSQGGRGSSSASSEKPQSATVGSNEIDLPKAATIKPINPLIEKLSR